MSYIHREWLIVCRVLPDHSELIPFVLEYAEQQLELPYDSHYKAEQGQKKKSWYCSELIVHAFSEANKGVFLFEETPMSFRDMETG